MDEEFKNPGYNLFLKISKKKLAELTGPEIRLLNTCSIYTDEDKIDACVRGFYEGAVYSKEITQEKLNELKKLMM